MVGQVGRTSATELLLDSVGAGWGRLRTLHWMLGSELGLSEVRA